VQELTEFVLKSDLQMVIRLVLDVANQSFDLGLTHLKAAVTALPIKLFNSLGFNPARGTALEELN
jgi:hypothetical protein